MKITKQPEHGDLRVIHVPQVPMKGFTVPVKSPIEGKKVMDLLADYDLFQYENRVKPDYTNAASLEVYNAEVQEWETWHSDTDCDIDDLVIDMDHLGREVLLEKTYV